LLGAESKIQILVSSVAPLKAPSIFTLDAAALLAVLQKTGYYIASCLLVSAYSSKIKERFSSIEKISLSWLRTLLVLFIILCFVFTFYSLFASPFGVYREAGYLFYLLSAVVAYVFAFKALVQPEVFSRLEAVLNTDPVQYDIKAASAAPVVSSDIPINRGGTAHKEKYQRSSLSSVEAAGIRRKLVEIMESERLFLEPELTLPELSEKLSVLPYHLSQVINEELNKSFYDFVNEHRVREAQRLLSSPEYGHLSILGIALDAGFNSKSAFYTAFSKYTGMTPSEFRKRHAWTEPQLSERA
jgi:AraC-like DNA-binding protein